MTAKEFALLPESLKIQPKIYNLYQYIDFDAAIKLAAFWNRIGGKATVTSSYRTPAENAAVGGAANSYHMQGKAFDIRPSIPMPDAFFAARDIFPGIILYPGSWTHIHIDNRPTRYHGYKASAGTYYPVTDGILRAWGWVPALPDLPGPAPAPPPAPIPPSLIHDDEKKKP